MRSGNGRHRRPRQAPAIVVAAGVTGSALALPLLATGSASAADAQTWDRVAECESGGAWSANFGNGLYGGLQFTQDGWERHGGLAYAPSADLASRAQQISVAEKAFAAGDTQWDTCAPIAGLTHDGKAPAVDPGSGARPSASHRPVVESSRTDGLPTEARGDKKSDRGQNGNGQEDRGQSDGDQGDRGRFGTGLGQPGYEQNGNGQNGNGQGGNGQGGDGQGGDGQGYGPTAPGWSADPNPGATTGPAAPDASVTPTTPAAPATPTSPAVPSISIAPAPTGLLAIPGVLLPGTPAVPSTPVTPAVPATPDVSTTPSTPGTTAPGTGQDRGQEESRKQGQGNTKGKHRGDAAPEETGNSDITRESGRHAGTPADAAGKEETRPANGKVAAGNSVTADKADEYIVRSGDSLADIARRTGLSGGWSALYDANKKALGSDPDLIVPGQSLSLGDRDVSSDK
ncbi:secreted protein [Streptomyces laurentii]|uniref:Secreted protein n=1 Tax=Streptomyces laurentii TaxID=39478 RepID=A0A160P0C6_STRLU|nr:secreted protein [Streptomyces laurentii]